MYSKNLLIILFLTMVKDQTFETPAELFMNIIVIYT